MPDEYTPSQVRQYVRETVERKVKTYAFMQKFCAIGFVIMAAITAMFAYINPYGQLYGSARGVLHWQWLIAFAGCCALTLLFVARGIGYFIQHRKSKARLRALVDADGNDIGPDNGAYRHIN